MTVAVVEVAIVENKSECMDRPPGPKKVADVESWPLVEVRLYYLTKADQTHFLLRRAFACVCVPHSRRIRDQANLITSPI